VLNNNKTEPRKDRVCLVDASGIYTAQRAQNIMTDQNVEEVYSLCTGYGDVVEKAKVATMEDIRDKDYSLSVSGYIEKAADETISPAETRTRFLAALEDVHAAEERLKTLLIEEGYIHE
jgi:type I restriction enzyme M protein